MTKVQNITADIDNNVKPQRIMVDTTRCNNRLYSRLRWPFAANYQQSYPTLSVASFLANNTLTRACILITSRPNDLYNTHPPGLCVGQVKNWQRKIFFFSSYFRSNITVFNCIGINTLYVFHFKPCYCLNIINCITLYNLGDILTLTLVLVL